jgi:hypothetical protein
MLGSALLRTGQFCAPQNFARTALILRSPNKMSPRRLMLSPAGAVRYLTGSRQIKIMSCVSNSSPSMPSTIVNKTARVYEGRALSEKRTQGRTLSRA